MNLQLCLHLYIISFPGERERGMRPGALYIMYSELIFPEILPNEKAQCNSLHACLFAPCFSSSLMNVCVRVCVCVWMTAKLVIKRTRICLSSVWNWHRGLNIFHSIIVMSCSVWGQSFFLNSELPSSITFSYLQCLTSEHILQPLQVCVHTLFITVEGIPIPDSLLHLEKTAQHSTNSSSTRAILGGRRNQTLQK